MSTLTNMYFAFNVMGFPRATMQNKNVTVIKQKVHFQNYTSKIYVPHCRHFHFFPISLTFSILKEKLEESVIYFQIGLKSFKV